MKPDKQPTPEQLMTAWHEYRAMWDATPAEDRIDLPPPASAEEQRVVLASYGYEEVVN